MKRSAKRPLSLREATEPVKANESDAYLAWQIEQTLQGIKEADAGEFATAEEVEAVFAKYCLEDKRKP